MWMKKKTPMQTLILLYFTQGLSLQYLSKMTGSVGLENGYAAIVSGWVGEYVGELEKVQKYSDAIQGWPHIYVIFNLLTKAFKIPFSTSKTYVVHPRNQRKVFTQPPFVFLTFCFVFNRGGIQPLQSSDKGVGPNPSMLVWVTNHSMRCGFP